MNDRNLIFELDLEKQELGGAKDLKASIAKKANTWKEKRVKLLKLAKELP